MIHLAVRTAGADLRRTPARAVAVALLLLVAGVLPAIYRPGEVPALVLAAVVASSATAGAAAQHERRSRILAESGAGAGAHVLVAAAALVVPGAVAAIGATVVGLVTDGPPGPGAAVAIALLVPLVVAAGMAWAAGPAPLGRKGVAAVAVLIAVTAPLLVLPIVLLALLVGPRLGRARMSVRLAVSVVAAAVTVGAAVVLSQAETFFDLALLLLALAVPLTLAVGWLGSTAVSLVAGAVVRVSPTARLAATPLARRRRQLGPVAAVVAVVVTLAAAEGVVGASFEERESRRQAPAVLGRAGTHPDQAIALTTGLDPADERWLVAEAAGTTPVRVAVIDRVGRGSTEASPASEPDPVPYVELGAIGGVPPSVRVPVEAGPSWVGVVAPDALGPLGLDAHADALARGDALVLNPQVVVADDRVDVTGAQGDPLMLPAVVVSERVGLLLPAVLVSEARGDELGGVRNGARAVVVPGPGASADDAVGVADRVRSRLADVSASMRRVVDDLGTESSFVAALEHQRAVAGGDDHVTVPDIAPLDEVPLLARTTDQGQQRAVTLGALAVLVALAGTLLVVGGARAEDAVLLVQGAPDRHRITTAVVQTATVAVAGSALGAAVGLGLPALAFGLYNGRARDPRTLDIPYVLPPAVVGLLVGLPVAAALLAAAVAATRGRPSPRLLAEASRA
ncbi:MAG TPA: FtsX-like permease family protein [Iamia sp.]